MAENNPKAPPIADGAAAAQPAPPRRSLIAALRRCGAKHVFRWRRYWLGPEAANMMFMHVTRDLAEPLLRMNGVRIGAACDINTPLVFHNYLCKEEGGVRPAYDQLEIGACCHIGRECFFDLRERIVLGDRVIIAMRCTFITHIDVGRSALQALYPKAAAPIYIGSDSYIGAGAIILRGVTLGRGCLVAAGSVVTKSFGAGSLIAGVPARLVKTLVLPPAAPANAEART